MTIKDIIANIDQQNEEAWIFAKKLDDRFLPSSEAVCVDLTEDEKDLGLSEIIARHCPGFVYFFEVYLVKDMVEEFKHTVGYKSLDQQVDRIIHYVEFDA